MSGFEIPKFLTNSTNRKQFHLFLSSRKLVFFGFVRKLVLFGFVRKLVNCVHVVAKSQ